MLHLASRAYLAPMTHNIYAMFTVTPTSNDLPLGLLNASLFQLMRW